MINIDIAAYYGKLAQQYERIYHDAERQADLAILRRRVTEVLCDQAVLEVACGTGYWTAQFAETAESVLATDSNPAMLALAQGKDMKPGKVRFAAADAFDLPAGEFTACFAGSWWSHVKRQAQSAWLEHLRRQLGKDALLVMVDDTYVEGSSIPIARTDLDGNTHHIDTLDEERYEVLKNYPTDSALRKKLAPAVKEIRILRLEHYWMLTGKLK